eukprot:363816-Prorocentrum_minimum.AAC.1
MLNFTPRVAGGAGWSARSRPARWSVPARLLRAPGFPDHLGHVPHLRKHHLSVAVGNPRPDLRLSPCRGALSRSRRRAFDYLTRSLDCGVEPL